MPSPRRINPILALAGCFALLCLAIAGFELFLAGDAYFENELAERADQNRYHMPVIARFAEQLPSPNLISYPSATTPGYHLALAIAWRIADSFALLRLINIGVGALLVFFVLRTAARYTSTLGACALCAPFVFNSYVVGGTAWLTTDNAALLFVVLALSSALKPATPRSLLASGAWGGCAVLVRQVHMWIAGAPALAGTLASPIAAFIPILARASDNSNRSMRSFILGALAFAIPVLIVAGFALAWGGLVPVHEEMRTKHGQGWNPATFAFALAVFGTYSVFFASLFRAQLRLRLLKDPLILFSGVTGFIASMAFETSWLFKVRDYGWLWRGPIRKLDFADAFNRSPIVSALAVTGAIAIAFLTREAVRAGRKRETTILLIMMLGWVLAQSLNSMCWQRYFDPIILIFLAWLVALARPNPAKRELLGPALLALLALAFTAFSFVRDILVGTFAA